MRRKGRLDDVDDRRLDDGTRSEMGLKRRGDVEDDDENIQETDRKNGLQSRQFGNDDANDVEESGKSQNDGRSQHKFEIVKHV